MVLLKNPSSSSRGAEIPQRETAKLEQKKKKAGNRRSRGNSPSDKSGGSRGSSPGKSSLGFKGKGKSASTPTLGSSRGSDVAAEANAGPSGGGDEVQRRYSGFELIKLFYFTEKDRCSGDFFEIVPNRIRMLLRYIKETHHCLVMETIRAQLADDEDLYRLTKTFSSRRCLDKAIAEASKVKECPAIDAFTYMRNMAPESINDDVTAHTYLMDEALRITAKSQSRLAYHLARLHLSANPPLWEDFEDPYKEDAIQRLGSKKYVDIDSLIFSGKEQVSAEEAINILPPIDLDFCEDEELLRYVERIRLALACVKRCQHDFLYDLIKFRLYPEISEDLNLRKYSMNYVLSLAYEYKTEMEAGDFCDLFRIERLPAKMMTGQSRLPISEMLQIVSEFECEDVFLDAVTMIVLLARTVQKKDIDVLYTIFMHRLINRDENYKDYYVQDIREFKKVFLKKILRAEIKVQANGTYIDVLRLIKGIPEGNGHAEKFQLKYPALLCAQMIRIVKPYKAINRQVDKAVQDALKFVYPDELWMLDLLVQEHIRSKTGKDVEIKAIKKAMQPANQE